MSIVCFGAIGTAIFSSFGRQINLSEHSSNRSNQYRTLLRIFSDANYRNGFRQLKPYETCTTFGFFFPAILYYM